MDYQFKIIDMTVEKEFYTGMITTQYRFATSDDRDIAISLPPDVNVPDVFSLDLESSAEMASPGTLRSIMLADARFTRSYVAVCPLCGSPMWITDVHRCMNISCWWRTSATQVLQQLLPNVNSGIEQLFDAIPALYSMTLPELISWLCKNRADVSDELVCNYQTMTLIANSLGGLSLSTFIASCTTMDTPITENCIYDRYNNSIVYAYLLFTGDTLRADPSSSLAEVECMSVILRANMELIRSLALCSITKPISD